MVDIGQEIANLRIGQLMIFRQTAASSGAVPLRIETTNPPGSAEPEHLHPAYTAYPRSVRGLCSLR